MRRQSHSGEEAFPPGKNLQAETYFPGTGILLLFAASLSNSSGVNILLAVNVIPAVLPARGRVQGAVRAHWLWPLFVAMNAPIRAAIMDGIENTANTTTPSGKRLPGPW